MKLSLEKLIKEATWKINGDGLAGHEVMCVNDAKQIINQARKETINELKKKMFDEKQPCTCGVAPEDYCGCIDYNDAVDKITQILNQL